MQIKPADGIEGCVIQLQEHTIFFKLPFVKLLASLYVFKVEKEKKKLNK